jgi:hypothetical protein
LENTHPTSDVIGWKKYEKENVKEKGRKGKENEERGVKE